LSTLSLYFLLFSFLSIYFLHSLLHFSFHRYAQYSFFQYFCFFRFSVFCVFFYDMLQCAQCTVSAQYQLQAEQKTNKARTLFRVRLQSPFLAVGILLCLDFIPFQMQTKDYSTCSKVIAFSSHGSHFRSSLRFKNAYLHTL